MFDWQTSKVQPAEQDLVKVLNSRYSFRLNLDRKVIEHVCMTSESILSADNSIDKSMTRSEVVENKKPKISYSDDLTKEEEEELLKMDLDDVGDKKSKLD